MAESKMVESCASVIDAVRSNVRVEPRRRRTNQDIFVAKMSGDSEHDQTVIRNYQKRKKGSEFGLGVVLNRDSFRGWSHLDG